MNSSESLHALYATQNVAGLITKDPFVANNGSERKRIETANVLVPRRLNENNLAKRFQRSGTPKTATQTSIHHGLNSTQTVNREDKSSSTRIRKENTLTTSHNVQVRSKHDFGSPVEQESAAKNVPNTLEKVIKEKRKKSMNWVHKQKKLKTSIASSKKKAVLSTMDMDDGFSDSQGCPLLPRTTRRNKVNASDEEDETYMPPGSNAQICQALDKRKRFRKKNMREHGVQLHGPARVLERAAECSLQETEDLRLLEKDSTIYKYIGRFQKDLLREFENHIAHAERNYKLMSGNRRLRITKQKMRTELLELKEKVCTNNHLLRQLRNETFKDREYIDDVEDICSVVGSLKKLVSSSNVSENQDLRPTPTPEVNLLNWKGSLNRIQASCSKYFLLCSANETLQQFSSELGHL